MKRNFFKVSVASLLATVLLHYGVAWSVLRCFHDEDHAISEAALFVADVHDMDVLFSLRDRLDASFDCICPNYHTETLAGFAAPSKLKLSIAEVTSRLNEFLTGQNVADTVGAAIRPSSAVEAHSPPSFLIDSPRYLSFSVLRI